MPPLTLQTKGKGTQNFSVPTAQAGIKYGSTPQEFSQTVRSAPAPVVNPQGQAQIKPGLAPTPTQAEVQPTQPEAKGRDYLAPEKKTELATLISALEERGANPEQITQAAQNYFNENASSTPLVQETPADEPGFLKNLVRAVVNPVARLGVQGVNTISGISKAARGDMEGANAELDKERNVPFLGTVKPTLTDSLRPGARELLDVAGQGAELGSMLVGGGQGVNLVKNAGQQSLKQLGIQGAKEGAVLGASGGLGIGLQKEDASLGSVVKDTTIGGITGGVLGAGLGAASPAINRTIQKIKTKAVKDVDNLVGTIVQGKTDDITRAKKALTNLDVTGVKTYEELEKVFDTQIESISTKFDDVLTTRTKEIPLDKLVTKSTVGKQKVAHNYVDDALNQLDEYYKKINDPVASVEIQQLRNKAVEKGLTVKELNDLAKRHGRDLNAFNANGELASGLTKVAAENTRSGVKGTARQLFGDKVYESVDDELTSLIRTRDLVRDMTENVNKLKQKVTERGLVEKGAREIAQILDRLTFGGVSGFLRSYLVPSGGGLKVMNALDLEQGLQKNLKQVQEILSKDLSEKEIIKRLNTILIDISKVKPPKL